MNEFKVGDAVRLRGQHGRPQKWIISFLEDNNAEITKWVDPYSRQIVRTDDIAFYKEYVKKEKIIEEQL